MLLPVVEDWVKGVRSNQLQWSARLLGQEQWQPYSSGQVSSCTQPCASRSSELCLLQCKTRAKPCYAHVAMLAF